MLLFRLLNACGLLRDGHLLRHVHHGLPYGHENRVGERVSNYLAEKYVSFFGTSIKYSLGLFSAVAESRHKRRIVALIYIAFKQLATEYCFIVQHSFRYSQVIHSTLD